MGTKCILITNEAYERLEPLKEKNGNFSDVINKLTKKYSLLDLIGILKPKEAIELKRNIKDSRRRSRARVERTAKRLSSIS